MKYRYTLIGLITLSVACAGSETDTEGEGSNTGPTAQEELCADYPENIECPTLPGPPTLEDGTDFSDSAPKVCPPGYMADGHVRQYGYPRHRVHTFWFSGRWTTDWPMDDWPMADGLRADGRLADG